MHLIDPVASGLRGCEDGSVDVFVRGTGVRARYYDSFEADQPISPTGSLALDSNGSRVIYVNQLVEVVAYDQYGTEQRRFVAGSNASAVEVISRSLTGTDYETGQSAASKPTTEQVAWDRMLTSFGALDFNVLVGGSAVTLQTALSQVSGLFFNVRTYGAIGNGVADDTSAIQTAINAAHAAGDSVVGLPAGSYKIVGTLTIYSGMSLLGAGCGASGTQLIFTHATADGVVFAAAGSVADITRISGMRLILGANNSGILLHLTKASVHVLLTSVEFTVGAFASTGSLVEADAALTDVRVIAFACRFVGSTATNALAYLRSGLLFTICCAFKAGGGSVGGGGFRSVDGGAAIACQFDNSAVSAGGYFPLAIATTGANTGAVLGCSFGPGAGGILAVSISDSMEFGNAFDPTIGVSGVASGLFSRLRLASIESTYQEQVVAAATATIPNNAGFHVVRKTDASGTLDLTLPAWRQGGRFTLVVHNDNAAGIAALALTDPGGQGHRGTLPAVAGDSFTVLKFYAITSTGGGTPQLWGFYVPPNSTSLLE
jgi:hypothetical protein